jgi:subtilisin family serine protease
MNGRGLTAWSEPFRADRRHDLDRIGPFSDTTTSPGWQAARGRGITVAIVDSGVERDHPAVGGQLVQSIRVDLDGDEVHIMDDPDAADVVGHGTACAGIIHALAPEAELVSVRVLGPNNRGKGIAFAHALDWVIQQRIPVANLSLSSRSEALYATFHDLVDQAYFANCLFVCSASNVPGQESYPSLFSSVISVAAHDIPDPLTYFYNPRPPVEFGAWGVAVPVAWSGAGSTVATGNSFAAPHITGMLARLRSVYPDATPFEAKSLLAQGATDPAFRTAGSAASGRHR